MRDSGPPYIIKLLNLPVTASDLFVEDLFKSRFTPFIKFKIVADPVSNILETKVIKMVAFVELNSFQDLAKSVKWMDLYYKDRRRVVIEKADFGDFQNCIRFNQEHQQEIEQITDDFIHGRNQPTGRFGGHGSPNTVNLRLPHTNFNNNTHPILGQHKSHELPPLQPPQPAPTPKKSNPFGAAKPVDVLAKQHEIEKKLITINHTTVRTIGGGSGNREDSHKERKNSHPGSRRPSVNLLKRPSVLESTPLHPVNPQKSETTTPSGPATPTVPVAHPVTSEDAPVVPTDVPKSKYSPAPIPTSAYSEGKGLSLAAMLSSKHSDEKGGRISPSKNVTPKPVHSKPIILKKKIVIPATETAPESEIEVPYEEKVTTQEPEAVSNGSKSTPISDAPAEKSTEETSSQKSRPFKSKKQPPKKNTSTSSETDHNKFQKSSRTKEHSTYEPTSKTKEELAMILQNNEASRNKKEDYKPKYNKSNELGKNNSSKNSGQSRNNGGAYITRSTYIRGNSSREHPNGEERKETIVTSNIVKEDAQVDSKVNESKLTESKPRSKSPIRGRGSRRGRGGASTRGREPRDYKDKPVERSSANSVPVANTRGMDKSSQSSQGDEQTRSVQQHEDSSAPLTPEAGNETPSILKRGEGKPGRGSRGGFRGAPRGGGRGGRSKGRGGRGGRGGSKGQSTESTSQDIPKPSTTSLET